MIADSNLGPWKVGDLARLTGITVRALHHYDEIGLLIPSHHTESGHRLYTRRELLRLQHIVTLRHLGFSLEQIANTLRKIDFANGNVNHFLKFLAEAYVKTQPTF